MMHHNVAAFFFPSEGRIFEFLFFLLFFRHLHDAMQVSKQASKGRSPYMDTNAMDGHIATWQAQHSRAQPVMGIIATPHASLAQKQD